MKASSYMQIYFTS